MKKHVRERPKKIPLDELKYELTPELGSRLTSVHRNAGAIWPRSEWTRDGGQ